MEQIFNLYKIINDEYLYRLDAKDNNVALEFRDSELIFNSFLVFKNGYPNEEVFSIQESFQNNSLRLSTLYQISNSSWLEEIKKSNRKHSRHRDEMFDRVKHFIIFFSDELFECLADSFDYKIK